jgi:hypothetical protein
MLLTSCQTAALTHGDDGLALSRPCKGASARNLAPCERLPSILGTHEYVRDRTKCAQRRASSQRLSGSSVPSPVTDVSIGAYTVANAMFILGALGHRANTDGTRRSASPLRGLIFAAPACGARGTELLKARKVIEVQGNVSALRGQLLEPDRRRRPPARRPRRPRPRPGEGVVRRPSARLSCASCTRSGSWTARQRRVRDGA